RAQELSFEAVQLGLLASLIGLFADSQPLVQRSSCLFELVGSGEGLAQRAALERKGQPGPAGAEGFVTPPKKGKGLRRFPFEEHAGALEERAGRVPEGEPLLGCDFDLLLGGRSPLRS